MKSYNSFNNPIKSFINNIINHPIIAGLVVFTIGSLLFNSDKFFKNIIRLEESSLEHLTSIDAKVSALEHLNQHPPTSVPPSNGTSPLKILPPLANSITPPRSIEKPQAKQSSIIIDSPSTPPSPKNKLSKEIEDWFQK